MNLVNFKPSLRLSEDASHSGIGGNLLDAFDEQDIARLRDGAGARYAAAGETVFLQGNPRSGIYIILSGQVRIYYLGPSGREITLAYWSPGNFIGGPEVFGNRPHMWSGQAVRPTELLHVKGSELKRLVETTPRLAVALIEALEHKGACFSALIQMLGTRSASQRLIQLLVLMGELDGIRRPEGIVISRTLTQEDLAKMVGATRQWVSSTLDRLRGDNLVEMTSSRILIRDIARLRELCH